LQHFRHDRHEVIVFNVFDPAEVEFPFKGLVEFRDLETRQRLQTRPEVLRQQYLERFNEFVGRYRRDCSSAGIDYQFVNTRMPFELMLTAYLRKRQRIR